MIFDSVRNLTRYEGFSGCFAAAVKYLENNNLTEVPVGKQVIIEDALTCTTVERKLEEVPDFWEVHRKFIDIHIVVKGCEKIIFAPGNEETWRNEKYHSGSDSIVTKEEITKGIEFMVRAGEAIVFFPGELHKTNCPGCENGNVRKIILKVLFD